MTQPHDDDDAGVALVTGFLIDLNSGRAEEAWTRVSEDLSWTVMTKAQAFLFPRQYDKAGYVASHAASHIFFPDGIRLTVNAAAAAGERVFVEAETVGRLPDGTLYNNAYVFVARVAGGLIVEMKEYLDTAYTMEILGPAVAALQGE